jgi:hypothetical protein
VKVAVDVRDRAEGDRLKVALEDETTRAVMNVMGVLLPLSSRARDRVLAYLAESFEQVDLEARVRSSAADLPAAMRGS